MSVLLASQTHVNWLNNSKSQRANGKHDEWEFTRLNIVLVGTALDRIVSIGIIWVRIFWVGIIMGGNFTGGSCPRGIYPWWGSSRREYSGWELSWVEIVLVGVILSGNFPGGNCPGCSYPGWELSGREFSCYFLLCSVHIY